MGEFGLQYTERNLATTEEMDEQYKRNYGISRTALNSKFLRGIPHRSSVLEVGAGIGNQLLCLQRMGYSNLFCIDLQAQALKLLRPRSGHVNSVRASGLQLPFRDGSFELIFTSGVLIHIHPSKIPEIMTEIHRCARRYIWGLEYYSDADYTEVTYRGRKDLLWKSNYAETFTRLFTDLELAAEQRLPYLTNPNLIDSMYLLRKK